MAPIIPLIPPLLVICKAMLTIVGTGAATAALEGVVDAVTKQKHEKQLQECLERAFKQTKKQFKWSIKDKTAFSNFKSSLVSFAGTFEQDSLRQLLGTAIDKEISDLEVKTWIDNLVKQITLDEHNELFKYLLLNNIIVDSTNQKNSVTQPETKTNYILTSSASIYDNPEIICRDEFIDELLQLLSSGHKRVQITGMGGLGKTETLTKLFAKLAADKQHSSFDHIAFIRFSGDILSDIESQLDYPREYLGLKGIEAAKRYLHDICAEKNVLLCIDDIRVNQEIIKKNNPSIQYLRSLGALIVLAARAGFPDFEKYDLNFLSTKACIELFEKKFGRPVSEAIDVEILTNIIENRAGNHTLIINRLGNMAKDYGWSIPVLAERLKEKDFNFQKGVSDEELLQQEINKLYRFNEELSEAEKSIIEAFSIFPATPLSVELCVDWLYEDAGVDTDACYILLSRLAEKTWLEKRLNSKADEAEYSMHLLTKTAVLEQTVFHPLSHNFLFKNCARTMEDYTSNQKIAEASRLIQISESICVKILGDPTLFIDLSNSIATYYYSIAKYSDALIWYAKTKSEVKMVFGSEHMNMGTIIINIASVYCELGEYSRALKEYMNAKSIYEKTLGIEHPYTAMAYGKIADILDLQGNPEDALAWSLKALSIHESLLGKDNEVTAITYSNTANIYQHLEKFDLALELLLKAKNILDSSIGQNHPYIATVYNNIAGVYANQMDSANAYKFYMQALTIRETIWGSMHPATATTYNDIALFCASNHDFEESIQWFDKAINVFSNRLGVEHPITRKVIKNKKAVESSFLGAGFIDV